jgi:hypothetical protein
MALVDVSLSDIGSLFKDIRTAITGKEPLDPNKQLELITRLSEAETKFVEMKAKIIATEAASEHFITSAWRPITMLVFVFIIANNYILVPYVNALFSVQIPSLELTDQMWELLKLGIGGYIIGRSIEKTAEKIQSPKLPFKKKDDGELF